MYNGRFIRKPILYALHESIGQPISNNLGANTKKKKKNLQIIQASVEIAPLTKGKRDGLYFILQCDVNRRHDLPDYVSHRERRGCLTYEIHPLLLHLPVCRLNRRTEPHGPHLRLFHDQNEMCVLMDVWRANNLHRLLCQSSWSLGNANPLLSLQTEVTM